MGYVGRFCLLCILAFPLACSQAIPTVSTLSGDSFNEPLFSDGSNFKTFNLSTQNDSLTVSGTCNPATQGLELSFNNGSSWYPAAAGSDLSCDTDGLFSLSFSDCSNSISSGALGSYGTPGTIGFASPSDFRDINVLLRSTSASGPSKHSTFRIRYSGDTRILFAQLSSSAASTIIGSNYNVNAATFGTASGTKTIVGSQYKIKLKGGF